MSSELICPDCGGEIKLSTNRLGYTEINHPPCEKRECPYKTEYSRKQAKTKLTKAEPTKA